MTPSQLKKIAASRFVSEMTKLGFELGPKKFWFYRRREWLYDIVYIGTIAGGKRLRVNLNIWVPEMHPDYHMEEFPKGYDQCSGLFAGTELGPTGTFWGAGGWDVGNGKDIEAVFDDVYSKFKRYGLAWFEAIQDVEDLLNILDEDILIYSYLVEEIRREYNKK